METIADFTEFQLKVFKRINLKPKIIRFEEIPEVLTCFSKTFCFENLDIVSNNYCKPLTSELLVEQVLEKGQSGLCYKVNGILFRFLKEFGHFEIHQTRATVENQQTHDFWNIPSGHVILILKHKEKNYLIDAAFGCNLALRPIPITQEENEEPILVESITGIYRIRLQNVKVGDFKYTHVLEFRKSDDYLIEAERKWTMGYAFDPINATNYENSLTEVQQLVIDDPNKEFSINPLVFRLTETGLATLTSHSLTTTSFKGEKTKITFDSKEEFNNILQSIFNLPPLNKYDINKN